MAKHRRNVAKPVNGERRVDFKAVIAFTFVGAYIAALINALTLKYGYLFQYIVTVAGGYLSGYVVVLISTVYLNEIKKMKDGSGKSSFILALVAGYISGIVMPVQVGLSSAFLLAAAVLIVGFIIFKGSIKRARR